MSAVSALDATRGQPPCPRIEVLEEVQESLRRLYLDGFLVQNLLPNYYQLRNVTIRFLVQEPARPQDLFRRATNERAAQLLQDAEMMLRSVLMSVFQSLGGEEVRTLLESKQTEGSLMPGELNRALLDWAAESGGPELKQSLNELLVAHRKAFREGNTIWTRAVLLMSEDDEDDGREHLPEHLRCVDYLTFSGLEAIWTDLLDHVFSKASFQSDLEARLRERWREQLSKVRRLRNRVAHLRNISFQDMEDLVGAVDSMRHDLIRFAGWR